MQFMAGLGRKIAAISRTDTNPQVIDLLDDPRFLYTMMGQQAEVYPRALHILRLLTTSSVIQLPDSYVEMVSPETAPDIARYVRSIDAASEEHSKLYRLAWDVFGSEFASRHHQYEMFYAGAPSVGKAHAVRTYRFDEAVDQVDTFLKSYVLPLDSG